MKNKKIRIGIAGCGWIAEKAHIPAFINLEGAEICSVFDVAEERAIGLASRYNIHGIYNNYEEFLKSGLDAIVIATPNYTHADYSIKALEEGIHVLCEKPVAISSEEMKNVKRAAEQSKSFYVPGFVNRFRYDIRKMRDMMSDNQIGDIISIKSGWLRRDGIPRPGTWFTNRKYSGGGVLSDLGSHVIDICLMFLGKASPTEVFLTTGYNGREAIKSGARWFNSHEEGKLTIDVEDTAVGSIKYDGGVSVELELSWSAPVQGDYTYFTLTGTKGSMELKTLFGFSNDRLWENDSLLINKGTSSPTEINLSRDFNSTKLAFYSLAGHFFNVIREEVQHTLTEQDALKNVQVIEKLYLHEKRDT